MADERKGHEEMHSVDPDQRKSPSHDDPADTEDSALVRPTPGIDKDR
jgi:hypothetical protein